jgi:hypothetical protein
MLACARRDAGTRPSCGRRGGARTSLMFTIFRYNTSIVVDCSGMFR